MTSQSDHALPPASVTRARPSRRAVGVVALAWGVYALLAFASWLFDRRELTAGTVARHLGAPVLEAACWAALTFPILALADRGANARGRTRWVPAVLAGVVVAGLMGWVNVTLRNAASLPFAAPARAGAAPANRPGSSRPPVDARGPVGVPPDGRPPDGRPPDGRPRGVPFWLGVVNALTLYLAVLGAGLSRAFSRQVQRRREEALRREARLETQLAEARLDALRRQLDPHFLFNTLNAVSALVERDPRGVRRMIGQLSDLLRHSMSGASTPEIPLRQELELLERYVDIMRVRFDDQLDVETRVDPRTLDALVPNMVLQPLVENAIKHGVEPRADGGRVEIDAALDGDTLVLRVWDEGPDASLWGASATRPPSAVPAGAGVGLQNTAARLAQLYGPAHVLALRPAPEGGTVAEVRLPYHTRPVSGPTAGGLVPPDAPPGGRTDEPRTTGRVGREVAGV